MPDRRQLNTCSRSAPKKGYYCLNSAFTRAGMSETFTT